MFCCNYVNVVRNHAELYRQLFIPNVNADWKNS